MAKRSINFNRGSGSRLRAGDFERTLKWVTGEDQMTNEDIRETALWELRKVILSYEAWAANPYSPARASELSVHLCSARQFLEKHDLKHMANL